MKAAGSQVIFVYLFIYFFLLNLVSIQTNLHFQTSFFSTDSCKWHFFFWIITKLETSNCQHVYGTQSASNPLSTAAPSCSGSRLSQMSPAKKQHTLDRSPIHQRGHTETCNQPHSQPQSMCLQLKNTRRKPKEAQSKHRKTARQPDFKLGERGQYYPLHHPAAWHTSVPTLKRMSHMCLYSFERTFLQLCADSSSL